MKKVWSPPIGLIALPSPGVMTGGSSSIRSSGASAGNVRATGQIDEELNV